MERLLTCVRPKFGSPKKKRQNVPPMVHDLGALAVHSRRTQDMASIRWSSVKIFFASRHHPVLIPWARNMLVIDHAAKHRYRRHVDSYGTQVG